MKNSKINQELENIINLMGEDVSFVHNIKVQDKLYSKKMQGQVTDIVLSLDGNHQISVDGGEYFVLTELLEFQLLASS